MVQNSAARLQRQTTMTRLQQKIAKMERNTIKDSQQEQISSSLQQVKIKT